jgi:hypothetical protein
MTTYTTDGVRVSINKMPLPGLKATIIPLFASARTVGNYSIQMTEMEGVAPICQVWLIDKYSEDSVDMRETPSYAFSISTDTNTYGKNLLPTGDRAK